MAKSKPKVSSSKSDAQKAREEHGAKLSAAKIAATSKNKS